MTHGAITSWRDAEIVARMRRAERVGIDQTTSRCVIMAKGLVHVDTSTLQGSIKAEEAKTVGDGAEATWGSFDVNYAFWQEVKPNGGKPYLRPSAQFEYGLLAARVRRAFMAGG